MKNIHNLHTKKFSTIKENTNNNWTNAFPIFPPISHIHTDAYTIFYLYFINSNNIQEAIKLWYDTYIHRNVNVYKKNPCMEKGGGYNIFLFEYFKIYSASQQPPTCTSTCTGIHTEYVYEMWKLWWWSPPTEHCIAFIL